MSKMDESSLSENQTGGDCGYVSFKIIILKPNFHEICFIMNYFVDDEFKTIIKKNGKSG